MSKNVTNNPISDRITRERTYEIICGRLDKKDAYAQLVITLSDILDKGFTGKVILNCNQGGVNNIQVMETQKV